MHERVESVSTPDGSFDLTVWVPEAGRGPGLLLIEEIFGISGYIRAVAADLAGLGYVVGAPDLFWRLQPGWAAEHTGEGVSESLALASRFDAATGVADTVAALAALRGLPEVTGGTGIIGFCFGGTFAYLAAAHAQPDAVVSFYGSGVPDRTDLLESISCPLQLHFGGSDSYIPREQVRRVEEAALEAGPFRRKLWPELRDRLERIEARLSALEQRVGTGPDVRDLDQQIAQVRRDKETAIDAQDFENAAVLRDRERELTGEKTSRQEEWASRHLDLPSLSDEVERLHNLLREHGIEPHDGAA